MCGGEECNNNVILCNKCNNVIRKYNGIIILINMKVLLNLISLK